MWLLSSVSGRARAIRRKSSGVGMEGSAPEPAERSRRAEGAGELLAHPLAPLLHLRREILLEVGEFHDRADLDHARPRHRIGAAFHPRHRLVHVLDLPDPEPRDQLARPPDRPLDAGASLPLEPAPLPPRRPPGARRRDPPRRPRPSPPATKAPPHPPQARCRPRPPPH